MPRNPRLKADLGLVLATMIWGCTFVVVKDALAHVSPFVFLAVRFTLASLILAALYRSTIRNLTRADLRAGAVIGVYLFGGYAFQTAGLELTTPSKSAFITGSGIVLVPVLLALFWGRRGDRWMWAGAAAALAGLYYLTVPPEGAAVLNRGDLLTFVGAAFYALHIIYVAQFSPHHRILALTFLQVAGCAVLAMAAVPLFALTGWEPPRIDASPSFLFALAVTTVGCTVIGFSIHVWAQKYTTPAHTALVFSLEPVFAAATSYLVVGERLGRRGLLGAVLVFGGILLAEVKGPAPAIADSTDAITEAAAAGSESSAA